MSDEQEKCQCLVCRLAALAQEGSLVKGQDGRYDITLCVGSLLDAALYFVLHETEEGEERRRVASAVIGRVLFRLTPLFTSEEIAKMSSPPRERMN